MNFSKKNKKPTVYFPVELDNQTYLGNLYGYFHKETNIYNVVGYENNLELSLIGKIVENKSDIQEAESIYGLRSNEGILFSTGEGKSCKKELYSLVLDVFSRNTGILETSIMQNKCAIISGCGSVGSLVALELAKAGVGRFLLIDNDTVAYHNICRHQCGIADVGKYKVSAIKDRILQINPTALVETVDDIIENVPKEVFDRHCSNDALIIGCADNREGDIYANKNIAKYFNIPFVSIGFWERAFAGEIFYSVDSNKPCYECFYKSIGADVSARTNTNRRIYTNEADLVKVNFEPGISTDINFVTVIAIKLILDIFNIQNPNYTPKLLNHLTQFTLVCNTNDTKIGGEQAEIFSYPLQVTTSIEIDFCDECAINQKCKHS